MGESEPWKPVIGCGSCDTTECQPAAWHDVPAGAIAVEPAEAGRMTAGGPAGTSRRSTAALEGRPPKNVGGGAAGDRPLRGRSPTGRNPVLP